MQKAPVGAYKLRCFVQFIRPKGKIALLGVFCFKIKPLAAQNTPKTAKTLAFSIGTQFAIFALKNVKRMPDGQLIEDLKKWQKI